MAAETENAPNARDWRALTGRWRIGEQAVFDAQRMTVHVAGSESKISYRHAEVLKYLISRRGESVSRDDIRNDGPWEDKGGYILDTSVPGAINGIRTALKNDRAYLKTGKTGTSSYTLFSVVPCDDEEESEPAAASTSEAGNEADVETEGLETRMADGRQAGTTVAYTVGGIIAVVVIVGSTLGLLRSFDSSGAPPSSLQPPSPVSEYVATTPSSPSIPADADILYGSPVALDRDVVHLPNLTSDWISHVVSGQTIYRGSMSRVELAYADGLRALARGNLDRARQRIQAALHAAPQTPDYKAGLVAVAAAADDLDTARRALDELEDAELKYPAPTRLAARLRYLTFAAPQMSPQNALDAFDELLEQMETVFAGDSTAVAGALVGRGHALMALERWDDAYRIFQDAMAIIEPVFSLTSSWEQRSLLPSLGRSAREAGQCEHEVTRLKKSTPLTIRSADYQPLDAAIAIETVRCLIALDRTDEIASYVRVLLSAYQEGLLTESHIAQLEEIDAQPGA